MWVISAIFKNPVAPKTTWLSCTFLCYFVSPRAPTGDSNTLDNVDAELADVHEEENEESERAVTPAER